MSLILPSRFTQQPQGAHPIDWGNPITQSLVFCAVPEGVSFRDAVTGVRGTVYGTTTDVINPVGAGLSRNGTGRSVQSDGGAATRIIWPASLLRGATMVENATIIVLGGTTEQVDGKIYQFAGNTRTAGSGEGFSLGVDSQAIAGRGFLIKSRYSGSSLGRSDTSLLGTTFGNRTHLFGYSCTDNGVSGYWFAGGRAVAFSGKTAHGTSTEDRKACVLAPSDLASGTQAHNAYVLLALFWDRQLHPSEYASLYENPWQIFQAPKRKFWVNVAGGAVSEAQSETGSATDVISAAISHAVSVSEAGSPADVISATTTFQVAQPESGAASDSVGSAAIYVAAASDAMSAAELFASSAGYQAAVSDAVSVTAAQDGSASSVSIVSESVTAVDATGCAAEYLAAVTELGAATSSVTTTATRLAAVIESGSAADSASAGATLAAAVAELGSATESVVATLTALKAVTEAGTASDNWSGSAQPGSLSVAETLTAAAAVQTAAVLTASVTELRSAIDALQNTAHLLASVSELGSAAEALAASVSGATYLLLLTLTDVQDNLAVLTTSSDGLTLNDSTGFTLTLEDS